MLRPIHPEDVRGRGFDCDPAIVCAGDGVVRLPRKISNEKTLGVFFVAATIERIVPNDENSCIVWTISDVETFRNPSHGAPIQAPIEIVAYAVERALDNIAR